MAKEEGVEERKSAGGTDGRGLGTEIGNVRCVSRGHEKSSRHGVEG